MQKFNIGDRVKVLEATCEFEKGEIGVVQSYDKEDDDYKVVKEESFGQEVFDLSEYDWFYVEKIELATPGAHEKDIKYIIGSDKFKDLKSAKKHLETLSNGEYAVYEVKKVHVATVSTKKNVKGI